MKSMNKFLKYIILTGLLVAGGLFYYFNFTSIEPTTGIYPFDKKRDSAFMHEIFKENWYWLVCNYTPEYDKPYVDFFIEKKGVVRDPETVGKNITKVYFLENKPVGFITYRKKNTYTGYILFLGVKSGYRGKKIGRTLSNYAFDQFRKMGCISVELTTFIDNVKARKLYDSMGFKVSVNGEYASYRMSLK